MVFSPMCFIIWPSGIINEKRKRPKENRKVSDRERRKAGRKGSEESSLDLFRINDRRCRGGAALSFGIRLQRTLTFYLQHFEMLSHSLTASFALEWLYFELGCFLGISSVQLFSELWHMRLPETWAQPESNSYGPSPHPSERCLKHCSGSTLSPSSLMWS